MAASANVSIALRAVRAGHTGGWVFAVERCSLTMSPWAMKPSAMLAFDIGCAASSGTSCGTFQADWPRRGTVTMSTKDPIGRRAEATAWVTDGGAGVGGNAGAVLTPRESKAATGRSARRPNQGGAWSER